jgi:hypothetical protein
MKKKNVTPPPAIATPPETAAELIERWRSVTVKFRAVGPDQQQLLWDLLYSIDSVKKLLDRSERLAKCDDVECYRDIEGPKVLLADILAKFEKFVYDLDVAEQMVHLDWEDHPELYPGPPNAIKDGSV